VRLLLHSKHHPQLPVVLRILVASQIQGASLIRALAVSASLRPTQFPILRFLAESTPSYHPIYKLALLCVLCYDVNYAKPQLEDLQSLNETFLVINLRMTFKPAGASNLKDAHNLLFEVQ
jgi:hypothetical protein